ncbi:hypothetical protein RB601_004478 [Gaeumannomyces tritici]
MAATNTASPPRVRLRQGTYEGATRAPSALYPKALAAFLGVPYAQTTAGVNRFRPPRPLPLAWSWTAGSGDEPVPAVAYGEACPGILAPPPGVTAGEDCLNANVFVPAARLPAAMDGGSGSGGGARAPPPPLLPVVVYVHGGGFNMGLGAERDMASFVAWAADDVVGVSFNYRVGPLGFLAPPAAGVVAADEDGDGALNVGLRDQQMLFGWVADNIAAFGGDPANVTVMGMSAGAHSIGHHLIYYGAPDKQPAPFGKAILESGAATARSVLHPTHLRNASQYREFLAAAGVDGDGDGNDYKTVLSRLRALPLSKILAAGRAVWDAYVPSVCWPFQPVVDGDAIPDLPARSWRAGRVLDVPLVTGFNANEGTAFVPPRGADSDADFRAFFARLLPAASRADLDRLAASSLYPDPVSAPPPSSSSLPAAAAAAAAYLASSPVLPAGITSRQWRRLDAAYADYAYTCPVLQTAHYMSQLHRPRRSDGGRRSRRRSRSRVYVYRFAPLSPPWATANHAENAPFASHDLAQLLLPPGLAAKLKGGGGGSSSGDRLEEEQALRAAEARLPGVVATSAAMHAAYVRFAVSADGDPNHDGGTASTSNSSNSSSSCSSTAAKVAAAGSLPRWPAFESPFRGGTAAAPALARDGGGERGRLVVFGDGNEERLGGKGSSGTVARVAALSERELELCRFWWERVELSQGAGTRLVGGSPVKANL